MTLMTDVSNQSTTWIFQYNPRNYDLADFIEQTGPVDHWPANRQRSLMQPHQRVYILRAGGREGGRNARIEAVGCFETAADADDTDPYEPYRILIRYESWIEPPLDRETMRSDPVLGVYHPLYFGEPVTSFLAPDRVAERLAVLTGPRLRPIRSKSTLGPSEIFPRTELVDGQPPRQFASLLGQAYRSAHEQLPLSEYREVFRDPERIARAIDAHARLQNQLARLLENRGVAPYSPNIAGPNFDIAWQVEDAVYVAEMKSLTSDNEEIQLRIGLGQVLMYRYLLAQRFPTVRAILAVEYEPTSPSWPKLCEELGVMLLWPEVMEERLHARQAFGLLP